MNGPTPPPNLGLGPPPVCTEEGSLFWPLFAVVCGVFLLGAACAVLLIGALSLGLAAAAAGCP